MGKLLVSLCIFIPFLVSVNSQGRQWCIDYHGHVSLCGRYARNRRPGREIFEDNQLKVKRQAEMNSVPQRIDTNEESPSTQTRKDSFVISQPDIDPTSSETSSNYEMIGWKPTVDGQEKRHARPWMTGWRARTRYGGRVPRAKFNYW